MEKADKQSEGDDIEHIQLIRTSVICSANKECHIPAVLIHPHRRPAQPPILTCTSTPSMQSKDRAWKTTRSQPLAIGLDVAAISRDLHGITDRDNRKGQVFQRRSPRPITLKIRYQCAHVVL